MIKTQHRMDYYILRAFVLVAIILLIIGTICYYCIKHHSEQKYISHIVHVNNIKWESNN